MFHRDTRNKIWKPLYVSKSCFSSYKCKKETFSFSGKNHVFLIVSPSVNSTCSDKRLNSWFELIIWSRFTLLNSITVSLIPFNFETVEPSLFFHSFVSFCKDCSISVNDLPILDSTAATYAPSINGAFATLIFS